MIAYKCTDMCMKCREFQFEIGKKYKHDGNIELCETGFHYHVSLKDLFNYYPFERNKTRVFLVKISGEIKHGNDKSVCSEIEFIEEIKWDDLLEMGNLGIDNTGWNNSGYLNSGNRNSGIFNSDEPKIRIFNNMSELLWKDLPCHIFAFDPELTSWINWDEMTENEKKDYPIREIGGYLKTYTYHDACKISWDKCSEECKNAILGLPGFDPDIFEEITGLKDGIDYGTI